MVTKVTLDYAPRDAGPAQGAASWLELLFAAVLILVLLAFVVPRRTSGRGEGRDAAARADAEQLRLQLDAFKQDVGRYPTAAEGLAALQVEPSGIAGWRGPYLKRPPIDPWATPYAYVPPSGTSPPHIVSAGPDRQAGTADDIASR
jgi:general secretion pathway protein G